MTGARVPGPPVLGPPAGVACTGNSNPDRGLFSGFAKGVVL